MPARTTRCGLATEDAHLDPDKRMAIMSEVHISERDVDMITIEA
jgi:hypothetical protein